MDKVIPTWKGMCASWNISDEELFRLKLKYGEPEYEMFGRIIIDVAKERMSGRLADDVNYKDHLSHVVQNLLMKYQETMYD